MFVDMFFDLVLVVLDIYMFMYSIGWCCFMFVMIVVFSVMFIFVIVVIYYIFYYYVLVVRIEELLDNEIVVIMWLKNYCYVLMINLLI